MKIFDCHLHVEKGLQAYDLEISDANVIYNDVESYKQHAGSQSFSSTSLIFDFRNNLDFCLNQANDGKIRTYKIHSRIQQIRLDEYEYLANCLEKDSCHLPIIYDAFYFGNNLACQPSLEGLIYLVERFPKRNFIVAHAGGYDMLKYFFHLRSFQNVGFDLSLSLQYLHDTSRRDDIVKFLKFIDSSRLFFGSDFYFASPKLQMEILLELFQKTPKNSSEIEAVFGTSWLQFTQK